MSGNHRRRKRSTFRRHGGGAAGRLRTGFKLSESKYSPNPAKKVQR